MQELLIKLNACQEAKEWAGNKTWPEIFETYHRGDWLLWLFYKTMDKESETDFTLLTHAKGHCANTIRYLMKDARSINAVDEAINYSGDRIALRNAYAAAADAAYAAYAADADAAHSRKEAKEANQLLTANIVRQYIPIDKWNININQK